MAGKVKLYLSNRISFKKVSIILHKAENVENYITHSILIYIIMYVYTLYYILHTHIHVSVYIHICLFIYSIFLKPVAFHSLFGLLLSTTKVNKKD